MESFTAVVNAIVSVLKELGPLITAATPVAVIYVGWWTTKQSRKIASDQTKEINEHSTQTTEDVKKDVRASIVTAATGNYKALQEPPDGPSVPS